jgi:hypothetical protein
MERMPKYLIEQYWPDDHMRNLDDLYMWFNEKKEKKDSKLELGDRILFYEVGKHPEKKLRGAKALFASGTLTNDRFYIPRAEQLIGGKRWIFKRKVRTEFAVPPLKGIPLDRVRKLLAINSWPQLGFEIKEAQFTVLENELVRLQAEGNSAIQTDRRYVQVRDKPFLEKEVGTVSPSEILANPSERAARLEMSHNSHKVLLNKLSIYLRTRGFKTTENKQVDLFATRNGVEWIFEVKSTHDGNMLSQVRHGVSQLYEYRYQHRKGSGAIRLCLVLQSALDGNLRWVVNYLREDRSIEVCWPVPSGFGTEGDSKLSFS